MRMQEFVAVYPPELPPRHGETAAQRALMEGSRYWANAFGRMLYGAMCGPDALSDAQRDAIPQYDPDNQNAYKHWLANGFLETINEVQRLPDKRRGYYINELNFHSMNSCMTGMWEPVVLSEWFNEDSRREHNKIAQELVGYRAYLEYSDREKYIRSGEAHQLFKPQHEHAYAAKLGILQEYDTAVVLLDVVKHEPHLTVVPAPPNFARTQNRSVNANFVMLNHVDEKAIGVQTKTKVMRSEYDKADHERIVYIDGSSDFGNVRPVRTRERSSDTQVVSWPGIVAVKRLARTSTKYTQRSSALRPVRNLGQVTGSAQQFSKEFKLDASALPKLVGPRILGKL